MSWHAGVSSSLSERAVRRRLIRSVFPLDTAKAMAQEHVKGIEKKDLTVSFIPITCATPIIMAEPMGFYARHGLNVTVRRAAGWAVVRDWAINKEVDATHMLSPMPLVDHPGGWLTGSAVFHAGGGKHQRTGDHAAHQT